MLTYRHWIAPELAYGRRLQQRLHGSTKRGYYSINVCFGTPSRAFELVVDTGSFMTAVPCINCKTCGEHTHARRFNANASSTARDCHKNTSRTHSCGSYRMQYVEGSTISGKIISDLTWLTLHSAGNRSRPGVAVRAYFGCQMHESGLFRAQHADGILGMARKGHPANHMTLVRHELVKQHAAPDVFSLCLSTSGGLMLLGGRVRQGSMRSAVARGGVWRVPMAADHNGRYVLRLEAVYVQQLPSVPEPSAIAAVTWLGHDEALAAHLAHAVANASTPFVPLPLAAPPSAPAQLKGHHVPMHAPMLVDSGTSDAYLPLGLWTPLAAYLRAHMQAAGARRVPGDHQVCAYLSGVQLDSLPRLQLRFADAPNQPLLVTPQQYMVPIERTGLVLAPLRELARRSGASAAGPRARYCLAIHSSTELGDDTTAVLGAAMLRDFEVIFDATGGGGAGGAITFVPASCGAMTPETSMLEESYSFGCQ